MTNKTNIVKSVNTEKRVATFVVLEPQYDEGLTSDLHEDWYSEDDVFDAMMSFNTTCMKASLFHMVETSSVKVVESYCTKADMTLGDRHIKKGTWLASVHCPEGNSVADQVWGWIKDGTFNGISVQCTAIAEPI